MPEGALVPHRFNHAGLCRGGGGGVVLAVKGLTLVIQVGFGRGTNHLAL